MSFEDLHLSEDILNAVKSAGYEKPSPIQAQAIPAILEGRDIFGCAQTGTGKTAAFALPILLCGLLLLLQPGIVLYDRIAMQGAAAEGCRLLATSSEGDAAVCEEYVKRRLGSVPQHDLFHVHRPSCTWRVELSGNEQSSEVAVSISTELKPLPLIGLGAGLLGMTNDEGNLEVRVEERASVQPAWADEGGSRNPQDWIGSWV